MKNAGIGFAGLRGSMNVSKREIMIRKFTLEKDCMVFSSSLLAGGTGIGVYQAAKDGGKLAIGVDSNQNYLHPGTMLTSMLKRVDVAAYNAFEGAMNGTWKPGMNVLGLAEDGVGWALDENNESLITDDMKAAVEAASAAIIAGEISVHDYTSDNACTY